MNTMEKFIKEEEEEEKTSLPVASKDNPLGCQPAWKSKFRACKSAALQAKSTRKPRRSNFEIWACKPAAPRANSVRGRGKREIKKNIDVREGEIAPMLKKVRAEGALPEDCDNAAGAKHSDGHVQTWLHTSESTNAERVRILTILQKFDTLRRSFLKLIGEESSRRSDIYAGSAITEKKEASDFRGIGVVPGVNVGDCFFYRYELIIVGLHRQLQAGIAWFSLSKETAGLPAGLPMSQEIVAASIVVSGGYEDDEDNGDTLTYTGQGGNSYHGDRRQEEDQKPVKGNLALINSCKQKLPVRVIRGHHRVTSSPSGRLYSYDGLYMVEKAAQELGASGFKVFKFFLRRLAGQPDLLVANNGVRFIGKSRQSAQRQSGVAAVSQGQHQLPPELFQYNSLLQYPGQMLQVPLSTPCSCDTPCDMASFGLPCLEWNCNGMLQFNHIGNPVSFQTDYAMHVHVP